ncbi:hypothetical protein KQX64_03330 [Rhodopseudomonas palustris]|nr:hypothetical protein KQX64_03330 [Rhodopseudomonas palustris]
MPPPSLRIPIGLDMAGFRQSLDQAKSLTSTTTDFMLKEFAKNQLTLTVNSSQFKPAVQGAAKYLGDQFNAVKPVIQNVTRDAVRESTEAGIKVADAFAKPAITGSFQAFSSVGLPAVQGLTQAIGPLLIRLGLLAGVAVLVSDAIGTVREQLKQMVEIAQKSRDAGVSAEFFQSFVEGAKGAKDKVELFEGAIANAFQQFKPVLNPDWSVWDKGVAKISAVEQEMRGLRELFTTDQNFSGFELFRNAENNEQRIAAVLQFMKQLKDIGQEVAAIDLADKMFGAKFADQIRTKQQSIEGLIETVQTRSESMFSNNAVQRAKELDEQLKEAWRTVEKNLHPSMEALDLVGMKIKSVWVDIVKVMGEAAGLLNKILPKANDPLAAVRAQETVLQNRLRDQGLTDQQRRGVEDQLRTVQSKLAQAEASQVPQAPNELGQGTSSEVVPLPRPRNSTDAPTAKPEKPPTMSDRDRFEGATDSVEKRIAGLKAEADAIDLTTEARAKAKIAAELETIAKQANAAAGLGANVVTDEQRAKINALAEAYGKVSARIEQLNSPLATFARESADVGKKLDQVAASGLSNIGDAFADVILKTKSFEEAVSSMADSVIRDLIRIGIQKQITGPLAGALFGAGGVSGLFSGLFAAADGGTFGPGWGVVGEKGPELIKVHSGGVTVIPNHVSRAMLPGFASGGSLDAFGNIGRFPSISSPTSASGDTIVNVINNAGVQVQAQQVVDGRGNRSIQLSLDDAMAAAATRPGSRFGRALGVSQQVVRR